MEKEGTNMKKIEGGVTAALGFEAAATAAEIKYQNRTDMALVYSKVPCKAAGYLYHKRSKGSSGHVG